MDKQNAPIFRQKDKIAILARSEWGKSELTKRLQQVYCRNFIFDTLGEYTDGQQLYSFGDLARALRKIHAQEPENFRLVYQFEDDSDDKELVFEKILSVLWSLHFVTVTVEEIWEYTSAHFIPEPLKRLIFKGRHHDIGLIFTSQRPAETHKTILSMCQHIFIGQVNEINDIKYLSAYIAKGDIQRSKELIDSLGPYEFLHWRPGKPVAIVDNRLSYSKTV